jgi:hypothetical protein
MASLMDLDLKNVQPGGSFEPIPAGEYPAVIVSSEKKPTKDNTGQRLELKLQILNGPFQNRTLFDGLNIVNKSAQAQQIGRAQLKAVCVAAGIENPQHSEELHNRPLTIKVAIGKDQNGNPRNEIKGYKSRSESNAQQQTNMMQEAFETPASAPAAKANPFAKQ